MNWNNNNTRLIRPVGLFLSIALSVILTDASHSEEWMFFDTDNNFSGSLDEDGALSDEQNHVKGRYEIDSRPNEYNPGKFGSDFKGGNAFDRSGNYSGKVDRFGHAYDRSGTYSGRIDRFGNVYDRAGNYSGKVKPKP